MVFIRVAIAWAGEDGEECPGPAVSGHSKLVEPVLTAQAAPYRLYIFDVDDVLYRKRDTLFKLPHERQIALFTEAMGAYVEKNKDKASPEFLSAKWRQLFWNSGYEIVSDDIIQLLKAVQRSPGAVVILATAVEPYRSYTRGGQEEFFYQHREATLKKFGVEMLPHLTGPWAKTYGAPHGQYPQKIPTYLNGILYTRGKEKGEALGMLLTSICPQLCGTYPQKITFYDDLPTNLASVGQFCAEMNIDYEEHLVPRPGLAHTPEMENWHKFQLNALFEADLWLGDEFQVSMQKTDQRLAAAQKKREETANA